MSVARDAYYLLIGVDSAPAHRGLTQFTTSAHVAGKATEKFERTTKNLTSALGMLGVALSIRQMVEYADTWTLINARIRLVSHSEGQQRAIQERLFQIAQRTRNTLSATAVLYTRVALNADQLGRSHEELLRVVESVNAAMLISGATGVEAAQAMRQFAQALGSGRVQGDEFRTMMEAMPMVARAIADEMGVAMGDLYRLSAQGLIDVQTVIDALIKKNEELMERSQDMPWTITQVYETILNAVTRVVGVTNYYFQITTRVGKALEFVRENAQHFISAVFGLIGAMVTYRLAVKAAVGAQLLLALATNKTAIATRVLTALGAARAWLQLLFSIRSAADAMYMMQIFSTNAAKALAFLVAIGGGLATYLFFVRKIEEATRAWVANTEEYNEALGEARDRLKPEEIKAYTDMADMIRKANQELILAAYQDEAAAKKQEVIFDAINQRIEARRNLQGEVLEDMLEAIDVEERLKLATLEVEEAQDRVKDAIQAQQEIFDRFAKNMQRAFSETFYDIFDQGVKSFRDLFSAIKEMFYKMLAEMLAAKLMKSIGQKLEILLSEGFGTADVIKEERSKLNLLLQTIAGREQLVPDTVLGGDQSVFPTRQNLQTYGAATGSADVGLTALVNAVGARAAGYERMIWSDFQLKATQDQMKIDTEEEALRRAGQGLTTTLGDISSGMLNFFTGWTEYASNSFSELGNNILNILDENTVFGRMKTPGFGPIPLQREKREAASPPPDTRSLAERLQEMFQKQEDEYARRMRKLEQFRANRQDWVAAGVEFGNSLIPAGYEFREEVVKGAKNAGVLFYQQAKGFFQGTISDLDRSLKGRWLRPMEFEHGLTDESISRHKQTLALKKLNGELDLQPGEGLEQKGLLALVKDTSAFKFFAKNLQTALLSAGVGSMLGAQTGATGGAVGGMLSGVGMGFAMGGPAGALVGGLSGALSGLISGLSKESEQLKRHQAVLEQNNKKLEQLRRAYEGQDWQRYLTNLATLKGMAEGGVASYREGTDWTRANVNYVMAFKGLREFAEDYGIVLDGSEEAFRQLQEAIEWTIRSMTTFANTLEDQRLRIEAYNKIFDVKESPQQALEDTYKVLSTLAPDLMKYLGLENLDLSTEIGRKVLGEGLKEIFKLIESGMLEGQPELLGAFADKGQLLDAILATKDALNELNKEIYDVVTDFPRAMDLMYYQQKYGKYVQDGPPISDREKQNKFDVTTVAQDVNTSYTNNWNVDSITVVAAPGDDPQTLLTKIEKAVQDRRSRGGFADFGTNSESLF